MHDTKYAGVQHAFWKFHLITLTQLQREKEMLKMQETNFIYVIQIESKKGSIVNMVPAFFCKCMHI
jgi:hypothetical protein